MPIHLPAAQRTAAKLAKEFIPKTLVDALGQQVEDQVIDTERGGDVKGDARMLRRRVGGEAGNILRPVLARAQEKRTNHHALRPAFHASAKRRRNRRLGQFHVRRFYNAKFLGKPPGKKSRDFLEHFVALVPPRPVIDNDYACFHIAYHGFLTRVFFFLKIMG
jgi:hypothetical protein